MCVFIRLCFHSDLKEVRIGVVKDFTVMLNVTNKAEDSAYYSQITLKHPADLDYIGPIQVPLKKLVLRKIRRQVVSTRHGTGCFKKSPRVTRICFEPSP